MSFPFHTEITVIFRDLDVLGHVNHAVYFTYLEVARSMFFAETLQLRNISHLPFILAEACCTFRSAATFGDRLTVSMAVGRIGHKSFDLIYEITAADGRLIATARTVTVCYDYANEQTTVINEPLRAILEANLVAANTGPNA
ncbi:MAG: acyl-CoA thioesterase [Gammaproteobacteria bacterium]